MDVYVMKGGKRQGPYQPFLLKEMLEDGELTLLDTVWHEGMEKWQPLGETDSLKSVMKRAAPVAEEPGLERERTAVPQTAGMSAPSLSLELTLAVLRQRRALGWRRFFSRQMDMVLAGIVMVVVATAFGWTDIWSIFRPKPWYLIFVPALLWIPLETIMLAFLGWTPGRLILGLRVVDREGSRPSFMAALKRSVLVWAGGMGLGMPREFFLPMVQWLYSFWHFQRYGSTLWDHTAGTQVIYREFHKGHAAGLVLFNAALASLAAWMILVAPLPSRFTDEEREAFQPLREAIRECSAPVAVPRKSGLPSPPGA